MLIKNHSFVDVITNSSTELFVGNTDKNISFIEELLLNYLEVYNKSNNTSIDSLESICKVEVINETNIDEWVDTLTGWDLPYWINTDSEQPEYNDFKDWDLYDKADKEWVRRNFDVIKEGVLGMVVIIGTGDNSIPYELFDAIESLFEKNSHRIHMG